MTARSRTRNLFGPHQPQTSRASRQRSRKQKHVARLLLEHMEGRVMLSADIVSVTNGPTGVVSPTAWLGALPGSIPLTDISLPGTYESASGPSLQDALLGSGSENEVNPPSVTAEGVNDAGVATEVASVAAGEAAILAGGSNQAANAAALAANTAALAAQAAAGITQTSTGAGLAIGLASDITGLASAIASAAQTAASSTAATADAAADTADAAVTASDTAAGATATAAGTADVAAGAADAAVATAAPVAGTADVTAGTADAAAGTADTAAAVADGAATAADVAAGAEGGIDPVADGVAAGLDTAGAVANTAAGTTNTAADVANVAADAANTTAATAAGVAPTANGAAEAANGTFIGSEGAADAADTAAGTAAAAAATAHTAAAVSDGISAASYVTAAASDGLTAQQYGSFAAGMLVPGSTTAFATAGNNPNNTSYQKTIYGLAVAGATAHSASAAAETASAVADAAAAAADTTAAFANTAAVNAVAAATAANAAAAPAAATADVADAAATAAVAAAAPAAAAATAADSAATAADSAAEALDAAAGIADGVSAGTEAAATAADTAAIALDATALATIEIPFVDIATAVAAAVADGVAAGLDATSVAADTADGVADGLAITADGVAAAANAAAVAADAAAAPALAAAAAADATAVTADAAATTADTAAATADAAAVTACETATSANEAADELDNTANIANHVATVAGGVAAAADSAFLGEVNTIQGTQTSLQTQTLDIADQLNAGIRSLDLRGALVNDTINLNAGQDFTGVALQGALNDMTSFLQANPSETIVVTLSANEAAPINSPNGFNADLNTLLNSSDTAVPGTTYNNFVYYSPDSSTTPDLGQVRGKIVFIPSTDGSWTPTPDPTTGQEIGWQPTEVVQDSHTESDPNVRWNDADNDNGLNDNGLIPTDLGNPSTLYRNNLTQDNTAAASPVELGDEVDAIAEQYFGAVTVTRTTGIVGMDDPDQNLINEIINENNLPIIVTSDSDAPGDTGTLRDAINQANSQTGLNTIEFADDLTGSTGNTIVLQSDLPEITNDLDIAGSVFINTNGFQGFPNASTHNVTEYDFVASDSGPVTQTTSTDSTPVYVNITGVTFGTPPPVAVDPIHITYGTALANAQLSGTATYTSSGSSVIVPGTFAYTSAAGTVLSAGNGQSEAVTFTPNDTTDFSPATGTVAVNVAKATPVITNVTPVNITYGTALANGQLSGTVTFTVGGKPESLLGTFTYSRAAGDVLHPGNGQSESITFIPTDTTDYTSVPVTVTVNVAQAHPTVTVSPLNVSFGTALANTQLMGSATFAIGGNSVSVPGTFTYNSAAGTLLKAGNGQSEEVTFTPADTADYATVLSKVTINVSSQAAPTVFVNPVNINFGTALANTQLSGIATFALGGNIVVVTGTYTYTTAAGSVLNAGNGQSEAVTFTPDDAADYMTVSSTVIVNVAQATPTVGSVNAVNITYGTALANAQLSGTAKFTNDGSTVSVPGVFTYTAAAGSVLNAGDGQNEAVTFTPNDTTDFTTASSTVTVTVAKATPTLGSVNAVNIIYGTPLANSQLSGIVTFTVDGNLVAVPGTFTYTGAAGSQLNIGNGQSEAVTFTPTDTTDYTTVPSSVTVNVAPITPTVTVTDAGGIYKGSPFAATGTVTGVAGVDLGTPTFLYYLASDTSFAQPLAGAPSDVGSYVAVALFAATGNYGVGAAETSFAITPAATATAITSSANPAVYGQPITYTATLTNTSGTGAVPVGAVQFVVDGVNSGSPVSVSASGQAASSPISFLTGASHSVQAVYIPSPNFVDSNKLLTQAVQSFAVEPDPSNTALTDLFIGSAGATSNDQVQVNPVGSSSTGSTGVKVQTSLNGVNTQTTYSQSFTTIYAFLQQGNDNVQLANTLTISAVVTAGNGNDNVTLGNGNNTVTLGNGNDNVSAGNGNNTVTLGGRNDTIQLGGGNNTVTAGNGNDAIQLGGGNNTVTAGNGNDAIQLGGGSNVVVEGNGNDAVSAGNGNNTVTAGNGNDAIQLGGGSNVVVEGNGNDAVSAGNGNNLIVGGLGRHTITVGNGTNILIDGSATVTNSGDSLRGILDDWAASPVASNQAAIRSRFTVNYNAKYANSLAAGSGIDWFFYKPPTTSNKKSTDFLN